ncbi:hypothetical protein [Roseovarius confluentis]|uniref:hypothetical protein n=1 Tax=Roseovarius confluentis TaxID=1852027 RepID=UPI003BAB3094
MSRRSSYKERVEEIFGLTDPIVIAVINRGEDGVFTPDNLALVERLTAGGGAAARRWTPTGW